LQMFLALILSIVAWELLRVASRNLLAHTYYQRQSDDTIIQVRVLIWDMKTKKDLTARGYTREFPMLKEGE